MSSDSNIVDVLVSLPEVDVDKIGAIGHSAGANILRDFMMKRNLTAQLTSMHKVRRNSLLFRHSRLQEKLSTEHAIYSCSPAIPGLDSLIS